MKFQQKLNGNKICQRQVKSQVIACSFLNAKHRLDQISLENEALYDLKNTLNILYF